MKIIEPSYEILDRRNMDAAQKIEMAGRLAYKSEDKITADSSKAFFRKMVEHKHFPVIEFSNVHVYVKISRPLPEECEYDNTQDVIDDFLGSMFNEKFLQISPIIESDLLVGFVVSGTVRAFVESLSWNQIENVNYIERLIMVELTENKDIFPFNLPVSNFHKGPGSIDIFLINPEKVKELVPNFYESHLMCAVRFIHNRAFTHELVRHRPCSFIQESQRYCRYSENKFGNEVTFISPSAFFQVPEKITEPFSKDIQFCHEFMEWMWSMEESEKSYLKLLKTSSPQAARTVLPNSCKTEIILYATITEWKHIFKMRCSTAAEPSMLQVMLPLHMDFFTEYNMQLWE